MFESFSYTITRYHLAYGVVTLSPANFCKHYLQNHRVSLNIWMFLLRVGYVFNLYPPNYSVTLHLWVPHINSRLCFLLYLQNPNLRSIYGCATLNQLKFVSSLYRITGLPYSYGCATKNAHYVCKIYLHNHWVTRY